MQQCYFCNNNYGVFEAVETKSIKHFTESVFYLIEQIARYVELNGKDFFDKLSIEISPEEFRTIDVIICNPGICQRDLAKLILRDRVRTGRILDSLEEKGLIKRYSDLKNKRPVKKMELSKKGIKYYEEITSIIHPYLEKFYEKFTAKQLEELKNMLKLLESAVSLVADLQI